MKYQLRFSCFVEASDDTEAETKMRDLYGQFVAAGLPVFPVADFHARPDLSLTDEEAASRWRS